MNNTILAERLKLLRTDKNYTQNDVCLKIHLSRSSYSNYENGLRTPSLDILKLLAEFYDTSLDYLAGSIEYRAKYPFFTSEELALVSLYRDLQIPDKKELFSYAHFKNQTAILP